jgi:hypothetical protein
MDVMSVAVAIKEIGAKAVQAALTTLGSAAKNAAGELGKTDKATSDLSGRLKTLAGAVGAAAVLNKLVVETSAAQFAQAQLAAALKSTGNAAGQTVQGLNEHAAALQRVTVFGDDAIIEAQNLLLTFTQIQGDTFPKATEAVLNVAQAMGTDLKSAAIQVGKALNDPILGVTALARSGIQFTEAQKEQIKVLVQSGKQVEAQRIILKELETQFGGSAAAARNTLGGAIASLNNAFGDLFEISQESSAGAIRAINLLTDRLANLQPIISRITATLAREIANFIGWLEMLVEQYHAVIDWSEQTGIALERFIVGALTGNNAALAQAAVAYTNASGAIDKYTEAQRRQLQQEQLSRMNMERFGLGNIAAPPGGFVPLNRRNVATGTGMTGSGISDDEWKRRASEFDKWFEGYQEKQRTVARDALAAQNIGNVSVMDRLLPSMNVGLSAGALASMRAQVRDSVNIIGNIVDTELADRFRGIGEELGQVLGAGISNAFQALTAKGGNIGDAFKALGQTVLSGLGDMLIRVGTTALAAAIKVNAMLATLFTPTGIAAALAVIALGGALKGVASRMVTTGQGAPVTAGGFGYTGMGGGGGITLPGVTYMPTAAGGMGSRVMAANPVNVTIIGPNDPTAQRQMQELIQNANRRGQTRAV